LLVAPLRHRSVSGRNRPRIGVAGPGTARDVSASEREEKVMGNQDKLENKADEKVGEAKEAVGKASGDDELQGEGKADQTKANLKQAGEKVKDAFR
jgi:uncharacterized protein YjbJ (UPF0337 family)